MAPLSQSNSIVGQALALAARHWLALIVAFFITRAAVRRYATPLRKYPGPFLASISRLWKFFSTLSGHTHLDHIALHEKYGRFVRIAPDEVSVSSPEAARTVLSAGKRFYKTDFYAVFPPPENPDIFTEIREDVHAQKKKVANVPYSMAAMQQLSPFIDDTITLLAQKMDGLASPPPGTPRGPIDLGNWLHWFAFDVLGEVAFSRKFGFLDQGRDVEDAIAVIDQSQWYNGSIGQLPFLDRFLRRNPMWKVIPAFNTKNAPITRMALEEMAKRRPFDKESEGKWRNGDGRQDLLASLIKGHLKTPDTFGEGDVFAVAHGAIFAGSDSTAATMNSFFWHVLFDQRVRALVYAEVQAAVDEGRLPPDGNVSWAEAQALPYLQACLKEAMRIRPAVGLNITRLVPPGGTELEGEFFPEGTRLALNGWVLHRDKATFGEDADVYRPERWLRDPEEARRMERYMFQFGGGAHVCIGRNLALLEINKVIPRLMRDYDFELAHPEDPVKIFSTFFAVPYGLDVYVKKRGHHQ